MLLETYTCLSPDTLQLPDFLTIKENVTGNPRYSMYNLSLVKQQQLVTAEEFDPAEETEN